MAVEEVLADQILAAIVLESLGGRFVHFSDDRVLISDGDGPGEVLEPLIVFHLASSAADRFQ
jgi:hypothetical protein